MPVQEHWFFDCLLHRLSTLCSEFIGQGKAVDTGDLILPFQIPVDMVVQLSY